MKLEDDSLEKKEARKTSIKEGSFASVMSGFGDSYISAFMVALTNNPIPISLLSSIPGLASPLAQIFGSRLMEKYSRKYLVVRFVFLQALMWLPIAALGIIFWKGYFTEELPYILIFLYTLLAIFGGFSGPSWFSWMGDIVPEKERGKYFSKRNRICGLISLIAFLLGAFILDLFKTKGFVTLGFTILFAIASTFRFVSFNFFRKQYEPELKLEKEYYFSFLAFLKRRGNFLKFTFYQSTFYFALTIASPFFTVYMLKELQFNYITYTLVSISSTVFYLIFLPLAGKFSDKYGNLKMLYISSIGYGIYPFLWIFIKNPLYLVFLPQLVIGLSSAGFSISTTNFIYDTVTPQRRGICTAYMNILVGIGVFLGSILGGLILKYYHPPIFKAIIFVFLVSGVLRLAVSFIFIPQIKEKERKDKPSFRLIENIQQSLLTRFPFYSHEKRDKK